MDNLSIKDKKIALRQYRKEMREALDAHSEKQVLHRLEQSVSKMEDVLREAGITLPAGPGFW